MSKLTISIVNYNAGQYLLGCLTSLEKLKNEVEFEIVVIDNASTDQSAQSAKAKFSRVKFIFSKINLGFGKAHNQVLEKAQSEYLLILNPDVKVDTAVLRETIGYMDLNPDIGALTPEIMFEDGKLDITAHRGFPTPFASLLYFLGNDSLYHQTNNDFNKIHEVDAITGAFFLTRKKVLEKVGYFDEDFFMYGEDIDLCYRIKKGGFKVIYDPEVAVIHYKGISSGIKTQTRTKTTANLETKKRSIDAFYEAMKIFYKKHYEKKYPLIVNWLIYFAINIKWAMAKRSLRV